MAAIVFSFGGFGGRVGECVRSVFGEMSSSERGKRVTVDMNEREGI
jgi:hypothetical protein